PPATPPTPTVDSGISTTPATSQTMPTVDNEKTATPQPRPMAISPEKSPPAPTENSSTGSAAKNAGETPDKGSATKIAGETPDKGSAAKNAGEHSTKGNMASQDQVAKARNDLMERLEKSLQEKNLAFESDRHAGMIFLPELFQFSLASSTLETRKQDKIKSAMEAFAEVLPCFASGNDTLAACAGEPSPIKLRGISIVGKSNHAGDQARRATNMTLAFGRASVAFQAMIRTHAKLFNLLGSDGHGLFRIEAMGVKETQPEMLRRVEFHLFMAEPGESVNAR
ncbi:MAG: hypothetical protein HQL65_17630, partial [Magnetococcales bacterium]|nr:hypothetical protein [Magnetococcales bacterium]